MHADIHLTLHTLRSAELRREAAEFREAAAFREGVAPRRDRTDLRTRLGWSLVELGLRLVNRPVARTRTHLA
ncbi:hypothetical protein ACIQVO_19735 [Streptomyces sp. NPDC101062]|uniref:hypothetical protein n=1 Tax=unclassified Streptomyces TaxID=2593676 RepID=UPI002E76C296|nr:hypothetical protein [Streptomyces sp. JV176]MEE1802349.1 hypothetical protein [Streptomyces sp. JV176]